MFSNKLKCLLILFVLMIAQEVDPYFYGRPTYHVVAPVKLRPNSDYHVSVSVFDRHMSAVEIDVKVCGNSYNGSFESVNETVVFNSSGTTVLNLQISDWSEGNYSLIVNGMSVFGFKNQTLLEFERKTYSVFIQFDKAIYKAGQLVRFRVIVVNPSLQPIVSDASYLIAVEDSKGTRIHEWNIVFASHGIVSKEFQLSDQTVLGEWVVSVEIKGQIFNKSFTVDEYVLPIFDVQIFSPPYTTYDKSDLITTVKAMYTYGKPVKGQLTLTVKLKDFSDVLQELEFKKPINGSVVIPVNVVRDLKLRSDSFENYPKVIEIIAVVEDCVSGRKHNNSVNVMHYKKNFKIELIRPSNTFKPGLRYNAVIKVANHDDIPVDDNGPQIKITIRLLYRSFNSDVSDDHIELHLTPTKGLVNIEIYPKITAKFFDIEAEYIEQKYDLGRIEGALSPSNNFIQLIMSEPRDAKVGQNISFEFNATEPLDRITYEIIGRGEVVQAKSVDYDNTNPYQFSLTVTQKMSPMATIIIFYVRDDQEIVSDAMDFNVEGVFETQVKIQTNVNLTEPGNLVDVRVDTSPNAFIGTLAMDQSLLLLKSGNDITRDDVINELKTYGKSVNQFSRYSTTNEIFSDSGLVLIHGLLPRIIYVELLSARYDDDYNARSYPNSRTKNDGYMKMSYGYSDTETVESLPTAGPLNSIRIRQLFPETWLFNTTFAGNNGSAVIRSTIPDTITSWILSAFAMHPITGLGITQISAKITVFRPFFIKLSLPYSVIRGETIALKANVFNYLSESIEAEILLENQNNDFDVINAGNETESKNLTQNQRFITIPANEGVSVVFKITPKKLGYIEIKLTAKSLVVGDAILKTLLVKPEGWTQTFNKEYLVNLMDRNKPFETFKRKYNLQMDSNAIPGSERVTIAGTGDILGLTVTNLDNLLDMPDSCGEQNVIKLVTNIVVLDYLIHANRLTQKITSKALHNLEIAYKKQLTYKRNDGSFNGFGRKHESGSTWLTAYVVKSFIQAKPYVFIDQKVINRSIEWLFSRQNTDGSFTELGSVSLGMSGGLSERSEPLTAYVLLAVIQDESAKRERKREILNAENYIWNKFSSNKNTYDIVIMTYALHITNSSHRDIAFEAMMKCANSGWNYLWWSSSGKEVNSDAIHSPDISNPNDVEMSGYALMTLVVRNDIKRAIQVLRWIISKQTSKGGFSTTQDTSIGIQALGSFAKKEYTNSVSLNIELNYQESDTLTTQQIHINRNNALVLQSIEMPISANGDYITIEASGYGFGIIQISGQYNLLEPLNEHLFFLQTQTDNTSTRDYLRQTVCTYFKADDSTGWAILEVELPSGYVADEDLMESHDWKSRTEVIDRVETKNEKTTVIFYLKRITREELCVTVPAKMHQKVDNIESRTITVFDYYKKHLTSKISYKPVFPESEDPNLCHQNYTSK